MRGKQGWTSRDLSEYRITPAGAGKTPWIGTIVEQKRDHPRRCGENRPKFTAFFPKLGSPPQVRGKHAAANDVGQPTGITPAGAGKTKTRAGFYRPRRDHPRRCGENRQARQCGLHSLGSPPQVRGKLDSNEPAAGLTGITPAGAGKTAAITIFAAVLWDHPRRCGENQKLPKQQVMLSGSPPQVRGKRRRSRWVLNHDRITPAGAGKTVEGRRQNIYIQDHPRRCGENEFLSKRLLVDSGSPPQVRGKLDQIRCERIAQRITPAGAGKTIQNFQGLIEN